MSRRLVSFLIFCLVGIVLYACGDKGTGGDDQTTGYYVYAHGYWQSPRNYGLIYKIDAQTNVIVDSTRYPNNLLYLYATPDGRELWGMGPDLTVVWNTVDFSEKRRFEELGAFVPFFEIDASYIVLAGIEKQRIYFVDRNTGELVDSDTISTSPWEDALFHRSSGRLLGVGSGIPKYLYYYDALQKVVNDSVLLVDISGIYSSAQFPVLSPDESQVYAYGGRTGAFPNWRVFDLESGVLLHEEPVWSLGNFVFLNGGSRVLITTPGDCHPLTAARVVPVYETRTFVLVDSLILETDSFPESPGYVLPANQGIQIPQTNTLFIGCASTCQLGPVLRINTESLSIEKSILLNPNVGFESLTIGRK